MRLFLKSLHSENGGITAKHIFFTIFVCLFDWLFSSSPFYRWIISTPDSLSGWVPALMHFKKFLFWVFLPSASVFEIKDIADLRHYHSTCHVLFSVLFYISLWTTEVTQILTFHLNRQLLPDSMVKGLYWPLGGNLFIENVGRFGRQNSFKGKLASWHYLAFLVLQHTGKYSLFQTVSLTFE